MILYKKYLPYQFHIDSILEQYKRFPIINDSLVIEVIKNHGNLRKGLPIIDKQTKELVQKLDNKDFSDEIVEFVYLLDMAANIIFALGYDSSYFLELEHEFDYYLSKYNKKFLPLIKHVCNLLDK